MTNNFNEIRNSYRASFRKHGDSPASLLTPKGKSELRFRAIDPLVSETPVKILDYGCGLGYFFEYLNHKKFKFQYTGVDIMPEFIDACQKKFGSQGNFICINPEDSIKGPFDLVFSSGVFNLATHADEKTSKKYALGRVKGLFELARVALVCDFLSEFVDFQQSGAQHFSMSEIGNYCSKNMTQRFLFRHDLLPYEMTLVAWKNGSIKRPENMFDVDANQESK